MSDLSDRGDLRQCKRRSSSLVRRESNGDGGNPGQYQNGEKRRNLQDRRLLMVDRHAGMLAVRDSGWSRKSHFRITTVTPAGLSRRCRDLGDCLGGYASVPAFLQPLQPNLRIPGGGDHPHVVVFSPRDSPIAYLHRWLDQFIEKAGRLLCALVSELMA